MHPIIGKVLDKWAFFRTHAAAVWYNKLAGRTVKDEIDEIKEFIAKQSYKNIASEVVPEDKTKMTVSYAYTLNGVAVISLLLKSGIQPGSHPFRILNSGYFPSQTTYGIYASTQSALDSGKLNSATISSSGSGSIYIGEAITYDNEGVMFIYPVNMI